MNKFYKGAVMLILSALGYGLLPIFALFAYKGNMSVTTLLVIRFSFAAALFFIYIFIKYRRINIGKRDLFYLFILGAVGYNLQARFYFSSVKYIPAALTSLCLYTYPMLVTILSMIFDKEKITMRIGVSITISFAGLVMILGTSFGKINGFGILLGLGSALVYSSYIVVSNRVLKNTPALIATAFIALFSSMGVFVLGFFIDGMNFHFSISAWAPAIGLVLFSTVLAMLFFFRGMELLGPSKASIISMMEPCFTVLLTTVIFHDHLTIFQLIGGMVVLLGSILVILSKEQSKTQEINLTQS